MAATATITSGAGSSSGSATITSDINDRLQDGSAASTSEAAAQWPSLRDQRRAVVTSACTYHNAPWCKAQLNKLELEHLNFTKVQFPSDHGRTPFGFQNQLVLAVAVDSNLHNQGPSDVTLFVAFRGTQTFQDLLIDLDIKHSRLKHGIMGGALPGQYHDGFLQRLHDIFPSMLRLCEYIREHRITRLIFCGHSLGGALAHLALIKFALTAPGITWLEDFLLARPISIAFGSPHFCDGEARDFIIETGLANQMFTFINAGDPVPRLLEDLMQTRNVILKWIYGLPKRCCSSICKCLGVRPIAARVEDTGRTRFWSSGFPLCASFHAFYTAFTMNPSTAPQYVWAGITDRDENRPDLQTQSPLGLSSDAIDCHSMGRYVRHVFPELLKPNMMTTPLNPGCIHSAAAAEHGLPREVVVSTVGPNITSCGIKFRGKHWIQKEAKIVIEGENLSLCHRWSVKLQSMSRCKWGTRGEFLWSLERCSDTKLVLNLENRPVDDTLVSFLTSTTLAVSIETPLGVSRECSVQAQDPWFDSCVECVMSCALAKLLLMQSCDQPLVEWYKKAFDTLISHNDLFPDKPISFASFLENAKNQEFDAKCADVWMQFAEPAIGELRASIKVQARAARSMAETITTSNVSSSTTGCLFPCDKSITLVSYRKCLEFLFQKLMSRSAEAKNLVGLRDVFTASGRRQASFYEYRIHAHWEQRLIDQVLEKQQDHGTEIASNAIYRAATTDHAAQLKLLKKGQAIYRIIGAHELLGNVRTVAFVGPTFAGKSTLINCLLDQAILDGAAARHTASNVQNDNGVYFTSTRRPAEAVEGRGSRQAGVQAFAMQMQISAWPLVDQGGEFKEVPVMLVEVPGRWGAERPWERLVHVPDLVVVVVSFAGETALQAGVLAEAARRHGCCRNIVVVVNGMDRVLHGNSQNEVWQKYDADFLTALQHEFSRSSRVPVDSVLMSVAIPDEKLETTTLENLKNLSVQVIPDEQLDATTSFETRKKLSRPLVHFRGDITRKLQQLILKLPHHQHTLGSSITSAHI